MPRTDIAPQTTTRAGITPTFTAAIADGHMFGNNGRRYLRVKNTDTTSKTVTVLYGSTVDGQTVPGKAITVPAATGDVTTAAWPSAYSQPDGRVWLDYSATTGVSVAVLETPNVS